MRAETFAYELGDFVAATVGCVDIFPQGLVRPAIDEDEPTLRCGIGDGSAIIHWTDFVFAAVEDEQGTCEVGCVMDTIEGGDVAAFVPGGAAHEA